ncbi:MAG: hypothetical protein C4305_09220 [Thermoleophilia bacterium]
MSLPSPTGIDSVDATALRPQALRTFLVHLSLAGACLGLLAGTVASARSLSPRPQGPLPASASGVVVLDLSLSIADRDYERARNALRRLMAADGRVGLVVFSDVPYELFPPGTPASALEPVLRALAPPGQGRPPSPWAATFRAGTRISSALDLAREILARERGRRKAILLVSDLQTAPEDVPALARTLRLLRVEGILLRVVPLSPSSDGLRLFQGLLGKEAFLPQGPVSFRASQLPRGGGGGGTPTGLLVLGGLLLACLALFERLTARLALPGDKRRKRQ